MILAKLVDGFGNKYKAKVSMFGQLVTGPLDFSKFYNAILTVNNTPLSAVSPEMGKQFVITDIIIYGNKGVGNTDATVSLYESGELDGTTIKNIILTTEIPKNGRLSLSGLNLITNQGCWITAVTDDNTVYVTVGGYYASVNN